MKKTILCVGLVVALVFFVWRVTMISIHVKIDGDTVYISSFGSVDYYSVD